jgi:hypothetical protein
MPAEGCLKMRRDSMFALALAVTVCAVAAFTSGRPVGAETGVPAWHSYHNDRYGTTIDYPDLFKAEPPPDSNDGRKFIAADGAEFAVYASYNTLDFDLAKFHDFTIKNLDPKAAVTYQARGDDWFVISGTRGDNVFYERETLSHKAQMTEGFFMNYPSSRKQTYDPIVARMTKSFRSGTGFQSP